MMPASGYLLALAAALLWGLTYSLDERVLAGVAAERLYFLHSLCGCVVGGAILLARGHSVADILRLDAAGVSRGLLLVTVVTGAVAALAILASIQSLGATRAAVLEISYPLFVALFSAVLFRERIDAAVLAGGGFIALGAAIIVTASR
jgi:drug/metabolite transporter (DMT)-like permease